MVSLRKYLYGATPKGGGTALEAEEPVGSPVMSGFARDVLDCIARYVFGSKAEEAQQAQIAGLRDALHDAWTPPEASGAAETVRSLMAQKAEEVQEKSVRQAVEMQHIFGMFNEALITLAEGKDRSVARLNRVQEYLQQAGKIEDIVAIRSMLSETVRFVKTESAQAQESASRELARFEQEAGKLREFIGGQRLELGGRPEGVARIREVLGSLPPGEGLFVVVFLLDRLQSFVQRYGANVAEELVLKVIKERVQPLSSGQTTFRWTPASLAAIFTGRWDITSLRKQVSDLNAAPLVHRIAVGGRKAALTMKPSHMVAEGLLGLPDQLVDLVDNFAGAHP
jgi:hypothetical protein